MFEPLRRWLRFVRFVCNTPQSWRDMWGYDNCWLLPWQKVYDDHYKLARLERRVKQLEEARGPVSTNRRQLSQNTDEMRQEG